jgi:glycosyltransferase involved in cell wall biosynthesis
MLVYVQELKKQGHNVFLFYLTSADSDPRNAAKEPYTWYLPDLKDWHLTQRPVHHKVVAKVKGLLPTKKTLTDKQEKYFLRDFKWLGTALDAALKDVKIDVVQVDFPWMMNVVDYLPKSIPNVFVSHEAKFVLNTRENNTETAERCKYFEAMLGAKYNAIFTLTDIEEAEWKRLNMGNKVYTSCMGVELPERAGQVAERANKLVFLGSGKHQPNLDGIRYFLVDIWPKVLALHPELTISITGIYEKAFLAEFEQVIGVSWVGFVPDLTSLMHGAISIAPIQHGSGIRVKILESMALGAAVVSTIMAAEGIGATNNSQIMLADGSDDFANAIDKLYTQADLYYQMATSGHQYVYEHFELKLSTQKRVALLQSIIDAEKP